jgi:sortase A
MVKKDKKIIAKVLALLLGVGGLAILISTIYPIASYEALSRQKFPTLLSPISESDVSEANDTDYTRASNWFIGVDRSKFNSSKIAYYTLSIPKLKIDSATVAIGGEELEDYLIQYPGTALPGKRGNAVIFGHSILPRFYNPKEYISIFSLLPTLEKGDEVRINYDGIEYLYRVESLFEVFPTDIQVLEQDESDSFLTLVTCTPPGDPRKPKRLIVRARVVKEDSS